MSAPRILLIVGGGIAAYKSCELVRLIRKGGGAVTCVLTEGGSQFVTPMALAALSGNQVHTSLWDLKNEAEMGHIQLSREADLVVVCPATADLMAKMAAGIADDMATTLLLATDKPVLAVPTMNVRMWQHAAVQRNAAWLTESGVRVMPPEEGEMACGEFGPGRLPEPEMVWLEIADMLGLDPAAAGVRPKNEQPPIDQPPADQPPTAAPEPVAELELPPEAAVEPETPPPAEPEAQAEPQTEIEAAPEAAPEAVLDPQAIPVPGPGSVTEYAEEEEEFEEEYEEEEEPAPTKSGWGGGLGGLLASIIPRTTPRRVIQDDDVVYGDLNPPQMEPLPQEVPLPHDLTPGDYHGAGEGADGGFASEFEGPMLPEPEPDLDMGGPLLAKKGRASSAPPTDREALNHLTNPNQGKPEPFEGEEAAAPTMGMGSMIRSGGAAAPGDAGPGDAPIEGEIVDADEVLDDFDPLAGQPDFEGDPEHRPLSGKHLLITAGPTHEPIDPVRFLGNRSSGKQGFAIAAAAAAAGARVTLIAGPVHLKTPPGVTRIDVESAEDMEGAVRQSLPADCAVMVAAVADWRTRDYAPTKIKKRGNAPPTLLLAENPDILAGVAASRKRPRLLIGFAAETENVIENAGKKRKAKGVDWIVANDVSGNVMGGPDNQVHLVNETSVDSWDPMSKQDVAFKLVERISAQLAGA